MFTEHCITNFWKNVDKRTNSECWLWKKALDQDGYGRCWYKLNSNPTGRAIGARAHRFVKMLESNNFIPTGLVVMHHCDNPTCCNPSHLSVGTVADNNLDKKVKGRTNSAKGSTNGTSKLTEAQVLNIRSRVVVGKRSGHGQPTNVKELAAEFKVHSELIRMIAHRRIWTHI